MTPGPVPFRRHAGLVVALYAGAVVAGLAAAIASDELDDAAGFFALIALAQVGWCVALGRPALPMSPGRRAGLGVYAGVLIGGVVAATTLALIDAVETAYHGSSDGPSIAIALTGLVAVGLVPFLTIRAVTRRVATASTARAGTFLLGAVTGAALIGGAIAALCLVAIPDGESAPMLAGLLAALGFLGCAAVGVFTLGVWLWMPFVRLPAPEPVPRATARERR